MRLASASAIVFIALALGAAVPSRAMAEARDVGIWYGVLYTATQNYIWSYGNGVGSAARMVGDVDGDGRDDIAFFYEGSGTWHALLSRGSEKLRGFVLQVNMASGHGAGSTKQFLADVNGDGYADAVAFWNTDGIWRVWYNDQHGTFIPDNTPRISGHGVGAIDAMMGTVDGDRAADAVIVTSNGQWHVARGLQCALPCGGPGPTMVYGGFWKDETAIVASAGPVDKRLLGRVTGDLSRSPIPNPVDAVIVTGRQDWYVAPNTGALNSRQSFPSTPWIEGYGAGSTGSFLAQIDGRGGLDAVVMFQHSGDASSNKWLVAPSQGSHFVPPPVGSVWLQNHGFGPRLQRHAYGPSNWQGFGDFDGDGASDPVVFHNVGGEWRVMPSSWESVAPTRDPDQMNYWQSNMIRHRPLVPMRGVETQQYDSGDSVVIADHLREIGAAGIDFLLLDLTNGPQGWYYERAVAVCNAIQFYNQDTSHPRLKVSLAIGGFQYQPVSDVGAKVETETEDVKNYFGAPCSGLLYEQEGRPLLTLYFSGEAQRAEWLRYVAERHAASTTVATDGFNIQYTYGSVPWQPGVLTHPYPCRQPNSPIPCDTRKPETAPAPSEYGRFTGWGIPYGTLLDPAGRGTAVVMPGWNTNNESSDRFISRTQGYSSVGFYQQWGWWKIDNPDLSAARKPTLVIINSFNEYAEETAVAPTETHPQAPYPPLFPTSETWTSAEDYWTNTVLNVATYKSR